MRTFGVLVVCALAALATGCQLSESESDANPSQGQMYVPGDGSDLVEQVTCTAMRDLLVVPLAPGQDGEAETQLQYTRDTWANGDRSCTCAVYAEALASTRAAGSMMSKLGGADGTCDVPIDYPPYPDPGLVGLWRFQDKDSGVIAEYIERDPGHVLNGLTVMFEPGECVTMRADDSGMLAPVEAKAEAEDA